MKLIKASEISAKILTLLDESYERVIIVSPYIKISKWHKLRNKLDMLKYREISLEIYVRDGPDNTATFQDLDELALPYKKVANLHTKLYLNEKQGIVTSMNLLLYSEINSMEIGHITETPMEYNELLIYYQSHLRNGEPINQESLASLYNKNLNQFITEIKDELWKSSRNSWFWLEGSTLNITTGGNNYRLEIINNKLDITTKLKFDPETKSECLSAISSIEKKARDLTLMQISVQISSKPHGIMLTGQSWYKLQSISMTKILETESVRIRDSIICFITTTDDQDFLNILNTR